MAEYAARTKIPAERTRLDIEALMKKRGADQFFSGDNGQTAILAFRLRGRHIRFSLPLSAAPARRSKCGRAGAPCCW